MFQAIDMYLFNIEMRQIVFPLKYSQFSISQSQSSSHTTYISKELFWSQITYFGISQIEIQEIEKNILKVTNGYKWH